MRRARRRFRTDAGRHWRSFPTALKWCLIPRELSYMGDRVFRSVFSKAGHPVAVATEPTVGYATMWAEAYRAAGEEPPPGFRDISAHRAGAAAWAAPLAGPTS